MTSHGRLSVMVIDWIARRWRGISMVIMGRILGRPPLRRWPQALGSMHVRSAGLLAALVANWGPGCPRLHLPHSRSDRGTRWIK